MITCLISQYLWHSQHQTKEPISWLNNVFNLFLAREAAFLFDFRSTEVLFGLFSFWQLSLVDCTAPAISTGYSRLMGRLIVFPFGSSTLAIISNLSHSSFTFRCTFFDMNDLSHHWIHSWFGSCFLQACFGIVLSNWADSDNTNVSENHSDVFAFFLNFQ